MRRLLLQASLALLMTPVIACAPTPAIVSGSILISAVSALEANSSGPVSSTHVENRLQNANEGAKDTAVPVGVMPAVATGGGVEEPNKFTIFFEFDSAKLMPAQSEALEAIVTAAKAGKQVRLVVSGHADRAGPELYNVFLSRKRARTVKGALYRRGLNRDWITITAHGETRPRVTTPDGTREPRNRRVEIFLGEAPPL